MKNWLLVLLTGANLVLLGYLLGRAPGAGASDGVLRGRALEIVDANGKVRASIQIHPPDAKVKMPDGSVGYPETVILRLITAEGRPNVKLAATERGSGLVLGGESNPTYMQLISDQGTTKIKLVGKDGKEQLVAAQ